MHDYQRSLGQRLWCYDTHRCYSWCSQHTCFHFISRQESCFLIPTRLLFVLGCILHYWILGRILYCIDVCFAQCLVFILCTKARPSGDQGPYAIAHVAHAQGRPWVGWEWDNCLLGGAGGGGDWHYCRTERHQPTKLHHHRLVSGPPVPWGQ